MIFLFVYIHNTHTRTQTNPTNKFQNSHEKHQIKKYMCWFFIANACFLVSVTVTVKQSQRQYQINAECCCCCGNFYFLIKHKVLLSCCIFIAFFSLYLPFSLSLFFLNRFSRQTQMSAIKMFIFIGLFGMFMNSFCNRNVCVVVYVIVNMK